jgi:hypothetical protein
LDLCTVAVSEKADCGLTPCCSTDLGSWFQGITHIFLHHFKFV